MEIGPESEPYVAEPLVDPFEPAEEPEPVRAPEEVPAALRRFQCPGVSV